MMFLARSPHKRRILSALSLLILGVGILVWSFGPNRPLEEVSWTFTSFHAWESSEAPSNDVILYADDRLLALGPSSLSGMAYGLLQDEARLEEEASEAELRALPSGSAMGVGIQLASGVGRVRMVVVHTPQPMDVLPELLREVNGKVGGADRKLELLRARLNQEPGYEGSRVYPSRWFRLAGKAPDTLKPAAITTGNAAEGVQPVAPAEGTQPEAVPPSAPQEADPQGAAPVAPPADASSPAAAAGTE